MVHESCLHVEECEEGYRALVLCLACGWTGTAWHLSPGPVCPEALGQTKHECPVAFFILFHVQTRFMDHFPTAHTVWMVSGQLLRRTQGNSSTYMVNEETLALFSHCENKRCNRNVTRLRANPWQVAEDGPLCQGPILPPTNISSCSIMT